MKFLLILLPLYCFSVTLDSDYINSEYESLSKKQKQVIREAYDLGNRLIIDGESYGYTLATFTLVESSAGLFLSGDDRHSFGLTHIQIPRARELLEVSLYYSGLNALSDKKLSNILETDNRLNVVLAGLNFKLNLAKWKSYSKAIRSHNGYSESRKIYNYNYYTRFVNSMQIIKRVINETKN